MVHPCLVCQSVLLQKTNFFFLLELQAKQLGQPSVSPVVMIANTTAVISILTQVTGRPMGIPETSAFILVFLTLVQAVGLKW
jgi:hypothetical protein